jgi:hypothetical protein
MQEKDEPVPMLEKEIGAQIAEGYASLERGEGIDGEESFGELDQRHRRYRDRQNL